MEYSIDVSINKSADTAGVVHGRILAALGAIDARIVLLLYCTCRPTTSIILHVATHVVFNADGETATPLWPIWAEGQSQFSRLVDIGPLLPRCTRPNEAGRLHRHMAGPSS